LQRLEQVNANQESRVTERTLLPQGWREILPSRRWSLLAVLTVAMIGLGACVVHGIVWLPDLDIGDQEKAVADGASERFATKDALEQAPGSQIGSEPSLIRSDESGLKGRTSAAPVDAAAEGNAKAVAAVPSIRDDLEAAHRYFAACSDLRTGCGGGPASLEAERAKMRCRAFDSLKADLASRKRQLESGTAEARAKVQQILDFWKVDRDLAGARDPELLAKLPENEQPSWRSLWAEADAVAKNAARE